MKVKLTALVGNYDRPTDTDRPDHNLVFSPPILTYWVDMLVRMLT